MDNDSRKHQTIALGNKDICEINWFVLLFLRLLWLAYTELIDFFPPLSLYGYSYRTWAKLFPLWYKHNSEQPYKLMGIPLQKTPSYENSLEWYSP